MVTKEAFLKHVEVSIQEAFEKGPGEHKTWQEMYTWMVAYFQSEDMADTSTKHMAQLILAGMPALTYEAAVTYLEEQYEGCLGLEPDEEQEMVDVLMDRVYNFIHE